MERSTRDRTTFVIAHRLSTILKADRILVLEDGTLVQQGRHEELLEVGGTYKHLYDLQFNGQMRLGKAGLP
jgi:subfamily B ATP-binding cassette protein MsbA